MKEGIGGLTIFQIVILFILLFTAIMCLTINRSKAYGVKDEVVNIIESSVTATGGRIDTDLVNEIIAKLDEVGYRTTGSCSSDEGWIGYARNGSQNNREAAFCIKINDVENIYLEDAIKKCAGGKCNPTSGGDYPPMYYYNVALFYRLDIPIIGGIFDFKMISATRILYGDKNLLNRLL